MFKSRAVGTFLCILACCLAAVTTTVAQEALIVGERHDIHIDSFGASDVVPFYTAYGVRYTLQHDGATYIALHFQDFDLAAGDRVVISDSEGGQSYTMTGRGKMNAGTFWAQHVKGDTAVIELFTADEAPGRGFVVDSYAAGFVDLGGGPGTDAICGANDKKNAVCYENSHPTEYNKARAVARLLINGGSLCTGWLASAQNHFVTNEHCITTASSALNTDYEFMAEAPNCNDNNCQLCYTGDIFSGATFIQDNAALDYALVQINSGNPAGTYGFLNIDNRDAVIGEEIYIPQHAGGRAKELGIESSASNDPGGICHVTTFSGGCSSGGYQDVGYSCDTEGGSSGSPVLARSSHQVIALHHCANCPNRGVPIDLVCDQICGFFGPECTTNADCDDANPCTDDTCESESCVHTPIADCCGNGVCDGTEDCNSCSADCFSGGGASCGNGVCEMGNGEDCVTCPSDCNGVIGGPRRNRFCCGDDATCGGDTRCSAGTFQCTDLPLFASCCGDGTCGGIEDAVNCETDCATCSVNADCDDGDQCTDDACNGGACSNTSIDCSDGDACTIDSCSGGVCDNSGLVTCNDGDPCTNDTCDSGSGCQFSPTDVCQDGDGCCPSNCDAINDNDCDVCAAVGASCVDDADCCSNKCRGPNGGKTCKNS